MKQYLTTLILLFLFSLNVSSCTSQIRPIKIVREPHWDKPIVVFFDPRIDTADQKVISLWNYPYQVAKIWNDSINCLIRFSCDMADDTLGLTNLIYYKDDSLSDDIKIFKALIRISPFIKDSVKATIICHEFGHVLGLHHSDDPTNIMFRSSAGYRQTPSIKNLIELQLLYPDLNIYKSIEDDDIFLKPRKLGF